MDNASESTGNLPPKRERSKEFKPNELLGPQEEHFRICVLGAERTGKTALVRRFVAGEFTEGDQPTTQSTELKTITVTNIKCMLEILDTGGSAPIYEDKHDKWIEWGEGFIICYDITNRATFDFIATIKKHIDKNKKSDDFPTIIVGTHTDKDIRRKVQKILGEKQAKAWNSSFIEVSSYSGEHIEQVFATLIREIRSHRGKRFTNPLFGKKGMVGDMPLYGSSPPKSPDYAKLRASSSGGSFVAADKRIKEMQKINKSRSDNNITVVDTKDNKEVNKQLNRIPTLRKITSKFRKGKKDDGSDSVDGAPIEPSSEQSAKLLRDLLNSETVVDTWTSKEYLPRDWNEVENLFENSLVNLQCKGEGFRIELGKSPLTYGNESVIEGQEKDIPFYARNFIGKEEDPKLGPVALSFESPSRDTADDRKVLLRTKKGTERFLIPFSHCSSTSEMLKYVKTVRPQLAPLKFVEISDPELISDFVKYEKQEIFSTYKFGLLYVKANQTDEDDMFANVQGSPDFDEFAEFLGTKIRLEGWEGFRGGLDTKGNSTGTHSIFTKHNNFEIMFHVSTMLPYQPDDKQHVERKRHLGNVVVFKEGNTPFDPRCIKSQFNHVFAVVQVDPSKKGNYKVGFVSKVGVPPFGPFIPSDSSFPKGENFRNIFLNKLVNAERASLNAKDFKDKLERTRKELLLEMLKVFVHSKKSKRKNSGEPDTIRRRNSSTGEERPGSIGGHQSASQSTQDLNVGTPTGNSDDVKKELNRLYQRNFKEKFKNKFEKKDGGSKLTLRNFSSKIMSYGKRLNEWCMKEPKEFDITEFLYLLNQLVQITVNDGTLITEIAHREALISNAKGLAAISSLFMYAQEQKRIDKPLSQEIKPDEIKESMREALARLLLASEAAAKYQENMDKAYHRTNPLHMETDTDAEEDSPDLNDKQLKKKLKKEKKLKKKQEKEMKKKAKLKQKILKNEEDIKKWAQIDIQTRRLSDAKPLESIPIVIERKSSQIFQEKTSVIEEKREIIITEAKDDDSTDDDEPDDIEIMDSLTREAEQLAAKLVQLLAPATLSMEEIGELLRNMGQVSKEVHETAGDLLSREHAKKLMETTQQMLLIALEMKKDPQLDTPTKRKDLLETVNTLLSIMKDVQVDAELNQMLQ